MKAHFTLQAQYVWHHTPTAAQAPALAQALALPLPIAHLLCARNLADPTAAQRFLNPDLKAHLGDPLSFPGAAAAARLLRRTIQERRPITVFGDYDADGITATAIMVTTIQHLGGQAAAFLPRRASEGYGLTPTALQRCLKQHPTELLITVDCGTNSPTEVDQLRAHGIQTIILDHHTPTGPLPAATIVNPKIGATPGAEHLCGAGVAFKVAHALINLGRQEGWLPNSGSLARHLLALVGLATVADVVPLIDENRVLVSAALKSWHHCAGTGLQALLQRAAPGSITQPTAHTLGYLLGPRINAAGRMADALLAYQLLVTPDPDHARELAARLEGFNGARHGIEKQMMQAALKQCDTAAPTTLGAIVAGGPQSAPHGGIGWHAGVIGIVAARLCDTTGLPAAVVALDAQQGGRGSARAGGNYNVLDAITHASAALDGFGGHAGAAGFNLKPGALPLFRHLFNEACAAQATAGAVGRLLTIDGTLSAQHLTPTFYTALQRLSPFGCANPVPRWLIPNLHLAQARAIGTDGSHLTCTFQEGHHTLPRSLWFGHGHKLEALRHHTGTLDIVCELRENHFRGQTSLELLLIDLRASPPTHPTP